MTAYLYQYVIGGIVFLIGLLYAARQGYFRGRAGMTMAVVIGGFVGFAILQGYLQFAPMPSAEPLPYRGGFEDKPRLGTALDYAIMIGYFLAILAVGTYFARHQKTTKDFFFAGQRFAWWLIAFSLVATTVGSYSFVKYSEVAYQYGLSSSMTYLNDWFWMPLVVFGWLPLIYFARVTSVPEYFQRRFNPRVRAAATLLILLYLLGYVGVNLYTMGTALQAMIGWNVIYWSILVACISAVYVTAGGQTSVIMTDLFQGIMLLATGMIILLLGVNYLGGFDVFWQHLPRPMREAFANFNEDASFNSVGIFWQDGIANTAMFYFLNQGILMRFLSARSVNDARKAALVTPAVLMVLAAIATACGGWVARAMVNAGHLPEDVAPRRAFFVATEILSRPGVFGLIVATLIAALMSTVDTLVTAIAAITVNDVYKPYVRPQADDRELLKVARFASVGVMVIGVISVPIFMGFESIYQAHGAFTAAVTPPLVITLLLSVFWRRFTAAAALWTLLGGLGLVLLTGFFPQLIDPFSHGVPRGGDGSGFFAGMRQHSYMRALFGVVVSLALGVIVTLITRPAPFDRVRGLVWGTVGDALRRYKGSDGSEFAVTRATAIPRPLADARVESPAVLPISRPIPLGRHSSGEESVIEYASPAPSPAEPSPAPSARDSLPKARLSSSLAQRLGASSGDLIYVSDTRWWLGGLRSGHAVVADAPSAPSPGENGQALIELEPEQYARIVTPGRADAPLSVQKLY